jgi:hypothetical protein
MTTSFSFKILSNDVAPSENNMDLVVKSVFMNISAKSSDGFSSEYGCQFDLPSPSPASYTPYNKVTQPTMVQWVKDMYPELIEKLEEELDSNIAKDRDKNIIKNYPLPFA